MLTMRVDGSGVSFIQAAALMPSAVELLIEYPPPRTPNLPATDGKRQHRRRRGAAVAIAFEAPAAADQRRRRRDVELREAAEIRSVDAGDVGCPLERPFGGACPQALSAGRMFGKERLIGETFLEQEAVEARAQRGDRCPGAQPGGSPPGVPATSPAGR